MLITKQAIQQLQVGFSSLYSAAWGETQPWGPQLATTIPSSTRTNTYGWMARIPKMREWLGPRVIQNLNTHAFSVENKHFELTVGVNADDIKDDQLGIYNPLFSDMGRSARKLPDQQLKIALQAGKTQLGFDEVPFFSTAHPLNPAGNQSNLFTSTPLTADNFGIVRAAMVSYAGEDGEPLGVMPRLLVVPPQLEDTANKIVTAEYGANGASNVQRGQAKVLVVPEFANEPTAWYLADVASPIKPLIWQLREAIRMVAMTDVTDQNVFMHNEFLWGVDGRGAASYGPWFLMARAEG